jgi:hypothetical protein
MTFARVNHQHVVHAGHRQQGLAGRHCDTQPAHIIAQRFSKTAGFEKVTLHVNDQQCSMCRINLQRLRFGMDSDVLQTVMTRKPAPLNVVVAMNQARTTPLFLRIKSNREHLR